MTGQVPRAIRSVRNRQRGTPPDSGDVDRDAARSSTPPGGPMPSDGNGGMDGGWWAANRDRIAILAIGGVAIGGIVCMLAIVLVVVLG